MGESLIDSWLNHVKNCQLHQTNFKVTDNWVIPNREKLAKEYQDLMESAEHEFEGVFKTTTSIDSLLKFAEIDNIGVDFINNNLYAVDIAFHEAGLNYTKQNYSTAMNITKKYLRSIFLVNIYFPTMADKTIIFASPKVNPKVADELKDIVQCLESFIKNNSIISNIKLELYINEKFTEEIYDNLIEKALSENDTNELFLRSLKLNNLCIGKSNKTKKSKTNTVLSNQKRVGVLAKELFVSLLKSNIDNQLLLNLQNKKFSKDKFKVNYPVLYKGKVGLQTKRYYTEPIFEDYYLTNDWYEKSRKSLEKGF